MTYIFEEQPADFNTDLEVVACYMCVGDEILFLLRHDHKSEGGKWGVPGGKVDSGETATEAMIRELREETGLNVSPDSIEYLRVWYVRYPEKDFLKHEFMFHFDTKPDITIAPYEHAEYRWMTAEQALQCLLIRGEDECLKSHFGV